MKTIKVLLASAAVAVALVGSGVAFAAAEAHPWSGKKVVYLGDSITDPAQIERHKHDVYWKYLQDLYGIEADWASDFNINASVDYINAVKAKLGL